MARRKKINKRVVVVWVALGVVLGLFAVTVLLRRSPRDPVKYARIGDEALERARKAWRAGEAARALTAARDAEKAFKVAVANAPDPKSSTPYLYKLALVQEEILKNDNRLTGAERAELVGRLFEYLGKVVLIDETHLDAQRLLCDLHWQRARAAWGKAEQALRVLPQFVDQADQFLEISPGDHETLFRRARAKARLAQIDKTDTDARKGALADFRAAIKADPGNVGYRLELIKYIRDSGRPQEEVLPEYEASIEANPQSAELRIDYANYLREIGRNEAAMDQINEAIRRDPNNPLGYMSLAERYDSENQRARALEALGRAKAVAPTDPRVYGMLAQTLRRMNKPDEAAKEVRHGLELAEAKARLELPDREREALVRSRAFLNYLLATMLLDELRGNRDKDVRAKNIAEAKACLEAISSLAPDSVLRSKVAGHLAFVQGRVAEAIPLLEAALKRLRTRGGRMDAHTANLLVTAYLAAGRPTRAERILQGLRQIQGEEKNPSMLFSLAQIHMLMREFRRAERLVDRVLRIDPDYRPARELKAVLEVLLHNRLEALSGDATIPKLHLRLLRQRVQELWTRRRRQEAIKLAEGLHSKAPKDSGLALMLVKMYRQSEQPDKAENLVKEVAQFNPEFAEELKFQGEVAAEPDPDKRFQMLIARAEDKIKDPLDRAVAKMVACRRYGREKDFAMYLAEAADIAPKDPKVVAMYFEHALKTGDLALAAKWAKTAADANADGLDGRLYAARLAIAKKDYKQAIATLEEVLADRPTLKYARCLLGTCYGSLKDYERAEAAYRAVLALDRSYLDAMIGMARVAELRGNQDESDQWIERAYLRPEGRKNYYVWDRYLRIMEATGRPEVIREVIYRREGRYAKNPRDLINALRLGWLYERNRQPAEAESMYRYVFEKAADKLKAVRPLLAFYGKTGQKSEILRLLGELDKRAKDKVAVCIAVGDALADYDPVQAEAAYRSAIEKDPNDPRGRKALAHLLSQRGDFEAAAQQLKQCLKLKADERAVEDNLILYEINARKKELVDEAARRLETILARNARDWRALALRGLLAFRRGRTDQALRYLDAAVAEAPPKFTQPRVYRAEVYRSRGEYIKARKDLEELRRQTDNVEIVRSYARTCQEMGDYQAAEMAYLDALKRQKREPGLLRGLMSLYLDWKRWDKLEALLKEKEGLFSDDPGFYLTRYEMWAARGNVANAIAALESALRVAPDGRLPGVVKTALLAFLDAKRYDKALALCAQHAGKSEFAGWLDAGRARALAGTGRESEADPVFRAALKKTPRAETRFIYEQMVRAYGPAKAAGKLAAWTKGELADSVHALMLLGNVFIQNNRYPEALATFIKARGAAKTPMEKAMATSSLGVAYQTTGNYPQAEKAYLEVLEQFPDHLEVLNNIAYLYADEMSRPKDALAYAKRAYDRAPGNPAIVDTYGWTLGKLGQWAEAQEVLSQAVQLGQSGGTFRFHLGRAYEENHLFDAAIRQYKEGLRLAKSIKNADLQRRIEGALERVQRKRRREEQE